ncbi:MAG: SCP2 sterol-binding domain-containing protein [Hespellia sp.]|nr:SCP2 sterol-binding domain-containing protein [Hespellia sp.]
MTYEEVLQRVREAYQTTDVSEIQEHLAYQFNIKGEAEGAFYVEITNGTLHIEPYDYYDRDVLFTVTAETLFQIMDGTINAIHASTMGKLKVEGNIEKALKLFGLMQQEKDD